MRRLLVSALLITALFACGKDKDKNKGAATGTATGTAAAPSAGTAAAPSAGTAAAPSAATPTTPTTPPPAAGDSAAGPRPASVTPEMVATAEKLIGAMEALGKDLTAAGTDCAKGAAALRAHSEKVKPIAAEAKKFEESANDEASTKWFEATYGQRMMTAMGGMMQLAGTCATDRDFQAASEEFDQAMDM